MQNASAPGQKHAAHARTSILERRCFFSFWKWAIGSISCGGRYPAACASAGPSSGACHAREEAAARV